MAPSADQGRPSASGAYGTLVVTDDSQSAAPPGEAAGSGVTSGWPLGADAEAGAEAAEAVRGGARARRALAARRGVTTHGSTSLPMAVAAERRADRMALACLPPSLQPSDCASRRARAWDSPRPGKGYAHWGDCSITVRNSPRLAGSVMWKHSEIAPALEPDARTRSLSPPNAAACRWTHCRPTIWSPSPKVPPGASAGMAGWAMKPSAPRRYCDLT
mmetsp:Transcript_9244/g.36143  ORF Transcript_9244/g.36143 Transcript_9244/m.36143 type:complete len:217 (-) Transcript_9244:569-1219(-)